jgi:hypothetical protein
MAVYPKISLSALRGIGWGHWDPIGLAPMEGGWPTGCADEYDSYLKHAADMCARGASREEIVAYLTQIASGHMGLSVISVDAAATTADAIAAYMRSLPEGPANIS